MRLRQEEGERRGGGGKKKKSWREKDKRVRVVNGAREAMRGKIEMMWKKEAEGGG